MCRRRDKPEIMLRCLTQGLRGCGSINELISWAPRKQVFTQFTRVSTVPGTQQMCVDPEGMNDISQEDEHICSFGGVGVGRVRHLTYTLSFGFFEPVFLSAQNPKQYISVNNKHSMVNGPLLESLMT